MKMIPPIGGSTKTDGGLAERFKAVVLKTIELSRVPQVRILHPPPL